MNECESICKQNSSFCINNRPLPRANTGPLASVCTPVTISRPFYTHMIQMHAKIVKRIEGNNHHTHTHAHANTHKPTHQCVHVVYAHTRSVWARRRGPRTSSGERVAPRCRCHVSTTPLLQRELRRCHIIIVAAVQCGVERSGRVRVCPQLAKFFNTVHITGTSEYRRATGIMLAYVRRERAGARVNDGEMKRARER